MLTERHKRCLERAWSQREVKVNKKFMRRRRYLTVRKAELEEAVEGVEGTISRIRDAMFDDLGVLLHVREDTEVNAEPVRKPEELSRAQSTRLRHQALATSEMLRQLRDRWLLQAHHFGEALEAFLAAEAFGVSSKRKYAADKKIAESLNESSLIRLDNSLVLIAERVVKTNKLHYKPSTILGWVRQFRTLGHFKRDGRGVHEREWILSEEDIRLELLQWLKTEKRVTAKKTGDFVTNVLLVREGGLERLDKYGLSLPVSSTTVHSWMVKLGCTYDRAGQSYYTDGHERKDVVEYRKEYVRAKRRHALRQPCWKRVEWEPLTADEKSSFDALVESEDKHLSEVIRFKDEGSGEECVEFHVDFLGGKSNEKHDDLRKEMGPEGGTLSVRFHEAAAAPCQFRHDPDVCKCNKILYHIGQDESIYRAYAREGNEWVIQGVRGLRKKTEGQGEMVSAFQDEIRGFGFPMTDTELARVNLFRASVGRPALETSPGMRFLNPGKNRDGY